MKIFKDLTPELLQLCIETAIHYLIVIILNLIAFLAVLIVINFILSLFNYNLGKLASKIFKALEG